MSANYRTRNWKRRAIRQYKKGFHDICFSTNLRTAWHEAGHALVAMMVHPDGVKWVYINKSSRRQEDDDCDGYCEYENLFNDFKLPLHANMPEVIVAGCVAEWMLFGKSPWESLLFPFSSGTGDYKSLIENYPIYTDEKELDLLIERTKVLLEPHRDELRTIAKMLLRKGLVSGFHNTKLWKIGERLPLIPHYRELRDKCESSWTDYQRARYRGANRLKEMVAA